ncbi:MULTISPECIES: glycosyltransferase family 2 protein [unclassified Fibrobacter]|uniref:glycosyltransferase family 2 protein n=1 Tax=unclassified Fibrobacter TaxID=2634177 RepID=UPI000D6ADE87|nr:MULTISPECIES: glycosyltransferase family 2 protein [unclassified Fibrobacter]PWJ64035.1 glycosyl transferase family 2 [Fibrobacter sp. UWR4]PZW69228.1 glycosyl transferase family 2 [Fibrobacter sp. UWR1]
MGPLISVIIPVFKVEQFLDQCVQSVVDQTYRNLEIILVDDGSPDTCPAMCDKWAELDARIKVVHKANGGLGDARNAGLKVATGDYIGFMDSDDWCEKDMFQSLLDACEKYNAPMSICNVFVDWECGWATETACFSKEETCLTKQDALQRYLSDRLTAWAWNKLYHKDLVPYLQYPKQSYEDIPVARSLFSLVEKVALTGKASYHYRQRQGSIVNSTVNESQYTLVKELRENVKLAARCGFEGEAKVRLAVSSFNFLEKLVKADVPVLSEEIPALVKDVQDAKSLIRKHCKSKKIHKAFMFALAHGVSYKVVFSLFQKFQWVYRKMNLKR